MLARAGDVETVQTERQGHATELAARAADAVVVFGGDGVVNEVLNGLPEGVPLGALPGGGTNVFARALGLPRDPLAAAARIADAIVSGARGGSRSAACTVAASPSRPGSASTRRPFAASTRSAVPRTDAGPATSRSRPRSCACSAAARFRLEPALEVEGLGRAACGDRRRTAIPTRMPGRSPLHARPRRASSSASTSPRRRASRRVRYRGSRRTSLAGTGEPPGLLHAHDVDRVEIACDRPLPLQADGEDLGDVEHVVFEAERDAIEVLA